MVNKTEAPNNNDSLVNDPHDSWDVDAFEATVKKDQTGNTPNSNIVSQEKDVSELNKPVEKVKEGDVSSIASRKVVYGGARNGMLDKQAEEIEAKTGYKPISEKLEAVAPKEVGESKTQEALKTSSDSAKELAMKRQAQRDPSPENLAAYEMVYDSWRESRDRAHKLEAEYNDKYQKHLESQSMLWRGVRRSFGLKPKLNDELEALQGATIVARRDFRAAQKELLLNRKSGLKSRIKTTSITQTPQEYGGVEAIDKRYQRLSAYHQVTGVYRNRLKSQTEIIEKVWNKSPVGRTMDVLRRHKYKTMTGAAVGATVLTGGTFWVVAAGITAGVGVGLGTYKILDKTWVASGRKKLETAVSNVGDNFFDKDFVEADRELEYLTYDIESRDNLSKTASKIAGAAAGVTAAGLVSGVGVESTVPDLTNSPTEITPSSPNHADMSTPSGGGGEVPLKEMGDASVAEKMYPEIKDSLNQGETSTPRIINPEPPVQGDMSPPSGGGSESVPEANGEGLNEERVGPDSEAEQDGIEDYEHEEDVFDEPAVTHAVERGDNAWNIMEGKGPDNNPVGGKSEIVTDMSLADRRYWLDKLFDYCDQNPDFAKEVGAVKSGGNIHMIHPGETINVSMLDEKLVELMNQEAGNNIPTPIPRPEDVVGGDALSAPEVPETLSEPTPSTEQFAESGPISVRGESGNVFVVENPTTDVNELTVHDAVSLYQGVRVDDPNALSILEKMGEDKASFSEVMDFMTTHGDGQPKGPNFTVGEYLNTYKDMPYSAVPEPSSPPSTVPEVTPRGGDYDPFADRSAEVREASFAPEAANDNTLEAVQSYVNRVEGGGGMFDWVWGNNKVGTFEKIADLSFGQIKEFAATDNMPAVIDQLGVTEQGYEKWMNELQSEVAKNPVLSDGETVRQYLARINTTQVAA